MDFENSEIYKKIFSFQSFTSNKIVSRESGQLEFKEQFRKRGKGGKGKRGQAQ